MEQDPRQFIAGRAVAVRDRVGAARVRRIPIREVEGPGAPQAVHPELAQAYRILGVADGVSRAHLNAAYLGLIERFSPAKVAALGPEFSVLAVRRLVEVTAALDTALKSFDGRD